MRIAAASLLCATLGCSVAEEPARREELFGDDRVADALQNDPSRAPSTFADHETLFGVGRACQRADSRELYVIEESATRFAERVIPMPTTVPRVVVSGCAIDPSAGFATSFGYFAVLPTDPARPANDPLARVPIEAMVLDRVSGTYSFYVFDGEGVQRIVRDHTGAVRTVFGKRDGSVTSRVEPGPRCFGCHVNGGPLMASLGDPWTSWVSTRSEKPVGAYDGETASIVSESNQLATTKRAAFANALEAVVRNGTRALVFGSDAPGSGLAARVLDGREPGGIGRLLRSVFCETELQWASAFQTVPVQLFVDPAAAAGSGLTSPVAAAGDTFPQLLPVRSDIDVRIEQYLVSHAVLSETTVRAVRLVDDARDIFSDRRCALLPKVLERLPATSVDDAVRAVLRSALDGEYPRAVLDGREDGKDAYFAALRARVEADLAGDRALLAARVAERQRRARAMFPGEAHPLPALPVAAP